MMNPRMMTTNRMNTAQVIQRGTALRWTLTSLAVATMLAACGGGDDNGGGSTNGITVNGKATFASVPSQAGGSLNYAATADAPVRGATVQLIDATGTAVATSTSDAQGNYSLNVSSAALPVKVRILAELKGSNYDFAVRDNTDGGALYGMDSSSFSPAASTTTTQDIHAPSGWGGSSYSADRVAGPFAILDVAYLAKEKVLGTAPSTTLKPLTLYWSPNNVPASGDLAQGQIGTSFFSTTTAGDAALFLLGAANTDTDEYDTPVVAHEIGHYLQHAVSRDDSVGGSHSGDELLDMRVAFSEGWGNAWSSMVRDNPIYFDSRGSQQASGFDFSVASLPFTQGWYSEGTVEYLLWQDYQDSAVGFGGIYSALTSLRTSPTFSSIFSFNEALRFARPSAAATITSRSTTVGVNGSNSYGDGETNTGGVASSLPVYDIHTAGLGSPQTYCVNSVVGASNKLGNFVYASFNTSGTRTITVTRTASTSQATDPDITVVTADGQTADAQSATANVETLSNIALPSGVHTFVINDFAMTPGTGLRCFDVTIN